MKALQKVIDVAAIVASIAFCYLVVGVWMLLAS